MDPVFVENTGFFLVFSRDLNVFGLVEGGKCCGPVCLIFKGFLIFLRKIVNRIVNGL